MRYEEWHDEVWEWLQGRDIAELEVREPEQLDGQMYSVWALEDRRAARWTCLQEFQGKDYTIAQRDLLAADLGLQPRQLGLWGWAQNETALAVTA